MLAFREFLAETAENLAESKFPGGSSSEVVGMGHLKDWTRAKFKSEYEAIKKQAPGASRAEKKKLSAKLNMMFANSKNEALADFFEREAVEILK